jgi:hypothetical protein
MYVKSSPKMNFYLPNNRLNAPSFQLRLLRTSAIRASLMKTMKWGVTEHDRTQNRRLSTNLDPHWRDPVSIAPTILLHTSLVTQKPLHVMQEIGLAIANLFKWEGNCLSTMHYSEICVHFFVSIIDGKHGRNHIHPEVTV